MESDIRQTSKTRFDELHTFRVRAPSTHNILFMKTTDEVSFRDTISTYY
jgi:hypothetical protein